MKWAKLFDPRDYSLGNTCRTSVGLCLPEVDCTGCRIALLALTKSLEKMIIELDLIQEMQR